MDNIHILTNEKEKQLWDDAIFVFDSSALLDLYSLPQSTRATIRNDVFEKLKERLWIPSHVRYECSKNRQKKSTKPIVEKYNSIRDNLNKFQTAVAKIVRNITDISNATKKDDRHPYLDQIEIEKIIGFTKTF